MKTQIAKYAVLLVCFALMANIVSVCRFIPGGDTHLHYFSVKQQGEATIIRVNTEDDSLVIDFDWRAQNASGEIEHVRGVNIRKFAGYERLPHLKEGMVASAGSASFQATRFGNTARSPEPPLDLLR